MTVQRGVYHGQFLLRIKKQGYTTIFITQGSLDYLAFGRLILLAVLSFVLVLALLYFAIRWLFQPLKVIQTDIQRIGEGELQHRISTVRRDEFGELAILKITDYGEGIAAEHLSYLTEPFYRADPSRQRKTGGYGLGLYLIRLIVEAHGGEVQIESEVGVGSSVVVRLPITNAPFI